MIRRLFFLIAFGALAWFVAMQVRQRMSEGATPWGSDGADGNAAGSIDQLVREDPLRPAGPSEAAVAEAPPSEEEEVTPPHGDPLAQELAEGEANGAGAGEDGQPS
jgi:hypothetical protein